MNNCTIDCIQKIGNLNYAQTCDFVQSSCQQSFVQFIQAYFCGLHSSFLLLIIFGIILFALLYLALNALTQHSLAPTVENFIDRFQISHTLAGVSFLAFANGSPDVLTAVLAGRSSSGSTVLIPFGSIFGASLFSTAFILSAVIFLSPGQKLTIKKNEILLPLSFYIFGILFLIIISITYQKMNVYLASILIVSYIVFIVFILKNQKKRVEQHKAEQSQNQLSEPEPENQSKKKLNLPESYIPDDIQTNQFYIFLQKVQKFFQTLFSWLIPPRSKSQWNFSKNIISLTVSPFVMALSQDFRASFNTTLFQIPLIVYLSFPALVLLINIILCQFKGWRQVQSVIFTIYSFIVTICWITIVCATLINLLELMQILTNVNSVYLGLTLLAWANSIGDYLSITMFAKKGKASTSVSGIFSGQLFNFLIGFGGSLFVKSLNGQYSFNIFKFSENSFEIISDSIVMLVICSGLIYFLLVYLTVIRTNGVLEHRQGLLFRNYYITFLLIASLIAISTDFFRQSGCDI